MSVPLAFLGTILIWSTTPLAVKWSSIGPGFMFAVTARMLIGTAGCLLLLSLLRNKLPWHKRALRIYVTEGLAIYGSMICIYWGAQFIPSGLISVIFGLTPLLTGLLAALWLNEQSLTPMKLLGMTFAFIGLTLIFGDGFHAGPEVLTGMAVILCAVFMHSLATVWIKRLGSDLSALGMTTGGLLVALPLYLLTWWLVDGHLPEVVPPRALWSIVYLGLLGSVMGFILFFYVLKHTEASRVGLIPLVTPVLALLLGALLNQEAIPPVVWNGTALILFGMSIYQWGYLLKHRFKREVVLQED